MRLASDNNEGDNAVSMLSKIKQASSHDRSEDTTWVIYIPYCVLYMQAIHVNGDKSNYEHGILSLWTK